MVTGSSENQMSIIPPFSKGDAHHSSTMQQHAIGVFDSGVGGLSVLRHIRELLPSERLIYVADSGHVPYGDKPASWIEQRSLVLTRFLIEQGADAIVIACNTATAAAATTPAQSVQPSHRGDGTRRQTCCGRHAQRRGRRAGDHRHAGKRALRRTAGALRRRSRRSSPSAAPVWSN